jgi:hypothetical protein
MPFEDISGEQAVGAIDSDGLALSEEDPLGAVVDVRLVDIPLNVSQNENHRRGKRT